MSSNRGLGLKIISNPRIAFAGLALACLAGCGGGGGSSPPPIAPRTTWTVLVYLNAANDLDAFSPLNISQMEQAAINPQVRFIVQWKQSTKLNSTATFNGTRRYLIEPNAAGTGVNKLIQDMGTGVDMGVPQTLNQFIKWGQTYYPSDHTVVVLWDHGNGWL